MNDIKLSGLKRIRESNNISREKLATDINLTNESGVNFVVTPEYIQKIESRKQKQIDDNLIKYLITYFDTTLEDICNVKDYESQLECTPNTKKITIKYDLVNEKLVTIKLAYEMEINELITDECVEHTIERVIKRFGVLHTKDEFLDFIQAVQYIFKCYNTYIKFNNNKPLEGLDEELFIQDTLNELEYGDQLNIMRIMGCAYKYFREDLKMNERDAQTLATAFIDVMLHNDEL